LVLPGIYGRKNMAHVVSQLGVSFPIGNIFRAAFVHALPSKFLPGKPDFIPDRE
jgi:hypothetical protein